GQRMLMIGLAGTEKEGQLWTNAVSANVRRVLGETCVIFGMSHGDLVRSSGKTPAKMAAVLAMRRLRIPFTEICRGVYNTELQAKLIAVLADLAARKDSGFAMKVQAIVQSAQQ